MSRNWGLWRGILGRLLGYGGLLYLATWGIHLYVTNPLYVKKLPYFTSAAWAGLQIQCLDTSHGDLRPMLREVSLPYFALNSQVFYIGKDGQMSGCRTPDVEEANGSVYRFASMSKVVTAYAMVDVAEENSVDLNTRMVKFFPEVDTNNAQDENLPDITLNHLLNHASGFGGAFGSDNMDEKGESPWCPYELEKMEEVRLAGTPGTNHVYSNVAYCLLGEVISRVTGTDYRTYIQKNYLVGYDSLGFVDGDFGPNEPEYDFSNDFRLGKRYVDWLDFHALSAAAGLKGKPEEFAQLVWELNRRNPELEFTPAIEGCREKGIERCYARGMVVKQRAGETIGIQQGYLPGVSSLVAISDEGEVLVWVAAGAALESKYKDRMVDRVVSFLSEH